MGDKNNNKDSTSPLAKHHETGGVGMFVSFLDLVDTMSKMPGKFMEGWNSAGEDKKPAQTPNIKPKANYKNSSPKK